MSNSRILKNSAFLYLRLLITLAVGLFSTRIVINALGVQDYGIYGVVAGLITMFGFMNAAMSSSTQRYLSFDLGVKDTQKLQQTFSTAVNIHLFIACLSFLLAEIIGVWAINYLLDIPADRLKAANTAFQYSLVVFVFGIIQVPYHAAIIAYERMNAYAYISIADAVLKLSAAYLLLMAPLDRLILYSQLLALVSVLSFAAYFIYVQVQFKEIKYIKYFDKKYYQEILSFSGWNLFGNIAAVARSQGVNMLINIFFGVTLNAAYAVTMMIQGVLSQFAASVQQAINPQIIKSYAQNDRKRTQQLIFLSSKYSFFVILLLIVPLYMNIDFVLGLWLGVVPESTQVFITYIFIFLLIEILSGPMMIAVQATGSIKKYQIVLGSFIFLNLPVTYTFYCLGTKVEVAFLVLIIIALLSLIYRLVYLELNMDIKAIGFFKNVVVKIVPVLIFALIPLYFLGDYFMAHDFIELMYLSLIIVIYIGCIVIFFGTDKREREFLIGLVKKKINRG